MEQAATKDEAQKPTLEDFFGSAPSREDMRGGKYAHLKDEILAAVMGDIAEVEEKDPAFKNKVLDVEGLGIEGNERYLPILLYYIADNIHRDRMLHLAQIGLDGYAKKLDKLQARINELEGNTADSPAETTNKEATNG